MSTMPYQKPMPPPSPPGTLSQTAHGEPALIGIVCACFWAVVWVLLYRITLPRVRQLPLRAAWGHSALQRQKAVLAELGFGRSAVAPSGLTDDHAADAFAWLVITGAVHCMAGAMMLPMIWIGYDHIGSTGHLLFFTGTWLTLGWCLFDALDETLRCFWAAAGPSGVRLRCPRTFWAAACLMHHSFWFALVLPMNAMLADLPAYHALVGSLTFGGGLQFTLRQLALVLGSSGRRMRGANQLVLALHAACVVFCRGALYFPLAIDVGGHLHQVFGGQSASELYVGPAVLVGCVNVAMILDAMKEAMFCANTNPVAQPGRPLRAADSADDLAGSPSASRTANRVHAERDSSSASATPPRAGTAKGDRPRKGKRHKKERRDGRSRCADSGVDPDEEMTFGFASAEFASSHDNSLEDENENEYHDDADDDASMVGDGPPATFRTHREARPELRPAAEHASRDMSPSGRLKDQARFNAAGRMPPRGETSRCEDAESRRARLRREMDEAQERRQQSQQPRPQQQRRERRPAEAAPVAIEMVDHAAIFASGVVPAKSNHYAMLGVPRSAGPDDMKKAYNRLAMKWHPDKNPSDTAKAEIVFMGIKDAYEILSDPIKRRRYDRLPS